MFGSCPELTEDQRAMDVELKRSFAELSRKVEDLRDGFRDLLPQRAAEHKSILDAIDEKFQQEKSTSDFSYRSALAAAEERMSQDFATRHTKCEASFQSSVASLDARLGAEAAKTAQEFRRFAASQKELMRLHVSELEALSGRKIEELNKSAKEHEDELRSEIRDWLQSSDVAQRANSTTLGVELRQEVADVSAAQRRASATLRSLIEEQSEVFEAAQARANEARRSASVSLVAWIEGLEASFARVGAWRDVEVTPSSTTQPSSSQALEERLRTWQELQQRSLEEHVGQRICELEERIVKEAARFDHQQAELQPVLRTLEDALHNVLSGQGVDPATTSAQHGGSSTGWLDAADAKQRRATAHFGTEIMMAVSGHGGLMSSALNAEHAQQSKATALLGSESSVAKIELDLSAVKTLLEAVVHTTKATTKDTKALQTAVALEKNRRLDHQSRVQLTYEDFERRLSARVSEEARRTDALAQAMVQVRAEQSQHHLHRVGQVCEDAMAIQNLSQERPRACSPGTPRVQVGVLNQVVQSPQRVTSSDMPRGPDDAAGCLSPRFPPDTATGMVGGSHASARLREATPLSGQRASTPKAPGPSHLVQRPLVVAPPSLAPAQSATLMPVSPRSALILSTVTSPSSLLDAPGNLGSQMPSLAGSFSLPLSVSQPARAPPAMVRASLGASLTPPRSVSPMPMP